jgi:ETFB lysine methyltransferase
MPRMNNAGAEPVQAPDSALEARFELSVQTVNAGPWRFEIFQPQSSDALIDEDEFAVDERLPYWAEIWPASIALVERLAAEQGGGRRLLELGCGVGLGAIAAARAGFNVTAVDYYAAALEFTQFNARHNGQSLAATRLVDWRKLPDDLPRFDVVAASDVLYERPNAALVAAAFARALQHGGLGLLADPQRQHAASFPDECRRQGLTVVRQTGVGVSYGPRPQVIDVYELELESSL